MNTIIIENFIVSNCAYILEKDATLKESTPKKKKLPVIKAKSGKLVDKKGL
mgnify:CR=1 FL=1